jgi:hypothetical protein
MATYLFKDENKAAFINGANSLFSKNGLEHEISQADLLDTLPGKIEFTLFITEDPQEIMVIDQAIKDRHFSFPLKSIDLKSMIKESKSKLKKYRK